MVKMTFKKLIRLHAPKWVSGGQGRFSFRILLERLGQVEALLYVIVAWTLGVNVPDAAVTSIYSAVLLQSLEERGETRRTRWGVSERKTLSTCNINRHLCH